MYQKPADYHEPDQMRIVFDHQMSFGDFEGAPSVALSAWNDLSDAAVVVVAAAAAVVVELAEAMKVVLLVAGELTSCEWKKLGPDLGCLILTEMALMKFVLMVEAAGVSRKFLVDLVVEANLDSTQSFQSKSLDSVALNVSQKLGSWMQKLGH